MELVDALDRSFDHAHTVIAGVRPDQYSDPTPCEEWTVRDLLGHVVGVVTVMGVAASGADPSLRPNDIELSDDPAAQFRTAADTALAGWRRPGAMDRIINAVVGP